MSSAYPGIFQGGLTTGYLNIGAVKRASSNTAMGFPGAFQGGMTTGYLHIGAVQNDIPAAGGSGESYFIQFN